jgi:hypothetical protein
MLRGKRVVFVGDSLNRNMWQSLVCALRASLKDKSRIYEVSGHREFKVQGFFSFKFKVRKIVLVVYNKKFYSACFVKVICYCVSAVVVKLIRIMDAP